MNRHILWSLAVTYRMKVEMVINTSKELDSKSKFYNNKYTAIGNEEFFVSNTWIKMLEVVKFTVLTDLVALESWTSGQEKDTGYPT